MGPVGVDRANRGPDQVGEPLFPQRGYLARVPATPVRRHRNHGKTPSPHQPASPPAAGRDPAFIRHGRTTTWSMRFFLPGVDRLWFERDLRLPGIGGGGHRAVREVGLHRPQHLIGGPRAPHRLVKPEIHRAALLRVTAQMPLARHGPVRPGVRRGNQCRWWPGGGGGLQGRVDGDQAIEAVETEYLPDGMRGDHQAAPCR